MMMFYRLRHNLVDAVKIKLGDGVWSGVMQGSYLVLKSSFKKKKS